MNEMNENLYKEFIKAFANIISAHDEDIADIVDYNYDSPLYQYYHSRFNFDITSSGSIHNSTA